MKQDRNISSHSRRHAPQRDSRDVATSQVKFQAIRNPACDALRRGYCKQSILAVLCLCIASLFTLGCTNDSAEQPLVVYCAHDAVFSESILKQFEAETGIDVEMRFDTEATKSLGLVELLLREKENPRCDVFWNNELLGTLDLQDAGVLHPYKGAGWDRIPSPHKDPNGDWVGFGARLRVWVINKDQHAVTQEAITQTLKQDNLEKVTVAKPLYGTTRTHYTVMYHLLGKDEFVKWHNDWRGRGLTEAQSNGQTRNLVAAGVCDIGWTDTDDHFGAVDQGKPVAMLPVRLKTDQVICIPNTAAIIKGTDQLEKAQKLVDFLASEKMEIEMANSASRQIPLGPVDESQISDDVKPLLPLANQSYPLTELGSARSETLNWLKEEYLN